MARYRVLAGQHVGPDPAWKPSPEETALARAQGRTPRAPSHTYKKGDLVESATDLVAKHGAQKFELVGGEIASARDRIAHLEAELAAARAVAAVTAPGSPTPENQAQSPAVFPGGQVSTGFQTTGGTRPAAPEAKAPVPAASQPPPQPQQQTPAAPDLDHMSVRELQAHAEENEIDLHGATKREDVLRRIRATR